MGNARVTTQSLEVVAADAERGLLLIKGSVPGSDKGWVLVKDAVKRKAPDGLPFPAALRGDGAPGEGNAAPDAAAPDATAPEATGEEASP
jgi:large subunit ribosomal protein L3